MVTLVVEDGTQLPDANTYISLADVDKYFSNRNNQNWAAFDTAARELAIFNAVISLDGLYQMRYLSQKIRDSEQGLQFPRYVFWDNYYRRYDQGEIPKPLKDAQSEIAFLDISKIEIFPEERKDIYISNEQAQVGELKTATTYRNPPHPERISSYVGFRKIDIILQPILQSKRPPMSFAR